MRRLLALLIVAGVLIAPATASAVTKKQRNLTDHYEHYTTCSTCPRSVVIDYGPDGKLNNRLWEAAAVNAYHEYTYYVWLRGRVYYQGGRCTSKPQWDTGSHVYGQVWNIWHEVQADRQTYNGSGPQHDGKPAYRYRRVNYHMQFNLKAYTKDEHKYVAITLRCDGTWAPAG